MRHLFRLAVASSAIGLLASLASASVRTCVTSADTGFSISPEYASVGSNPLYKGHESTVSNPLYSRTSGGVTITLTGANFGCVGIPSVAANGEVFAQLSNRSNGEASIVAFGPNGQSRTISTAATGDASGAPACTADGTVVFKSISQGRPILLTAAPGSAFTGSIPNFSLGSVRSVACSAKGDIIVDGTAEGSSVAAAYIGSIGGSLTGTLPNTANLQLPGVSDACYTVTIKNSSTQQASFVVAPRDVKTGQATGRRSYTAGRFALDLSIAADQKSDLFALCDSESIVLHSTSEPTSGQTAGLETVVAPPSLVSIGDSLGGGTVTALALSPQAFTGTGELMFWASIVDAGGVTSDGLFAITVPEPTTLGAPVSAGLLAFRRRARSRAC